MTNEDIEKAAKEYVNKSFVDYGDMNQVAENQLKESFIAGANHARNKTLQECIDVVTGEPDIFDSSDDMATLISYLEKLRVK